MQLLHGRLFTALRRQCMPASSTSGADVAIRCLRVGPSFISAKVPPSVSGICTRRLSKSADSVGADGEGRQESYGATKCTPLELASTYPQSFLSQLARRRLGANRHEMFEAVMVSAIQIYYQVYGTSVIPPDFVVPGPGESLKGGDESRNPWPANFAQLELGRLIPRFRVLVKKGVLSPSSMSTLEELKFYRPRPELKPETVLAGLKKYKEIHGHVAVPSHFVVPDTAVWPEELHGFKLGNVIDTIRYKGLLLARHPELRSELTRLGFVWRKKDEGFERIMEGLKVYEELHGHLVVPSSFVIPESPDWPAHLHGMSLGTGVLVIRQGFFLQNRPDRVEALNALGFVWKVQDYVNNRLIVALETYKKIYGKISSMKTDFIIPDTEAWPPQTRGYFLARRINKIRELGRDGVPAGLRDALEAIGFEWCPGTERRWQELLMALTHFKKIHGHVKIKPTFVVPKDDSRWPSSLHGRKLGRQLENVLRTNNFLRGEKREEREAALEKLGLLPDIEAELFKRLHSALHHYKKLNGHLKIPFKFTVPIKEPWPTSTHRLPLGTIALQMKKGRLFATDKERRAALGAFGEIEVIDLPVKKTKTDRRRKVE